MGGRGGRGKRVCVAGMRGSGEWRVVNHLVLLQF